MAATKLQMNWAAVSFTPSGGSLTAITKVTNVSVNPGGALKKFQGDTDKYPTVIVSDTSNPSVSITTGDAAVVQAIAIGTVCTLAATWKDAQLASGGNVVYAIANAVFENAEAGGAHQEFGSATATWQAYSADGTTSPVSFTRT